MAGARGRGKKSAQPAVSRRSTRKGNVPKSDNEVPLVFQDMISEAEASQDVGVNEGSRPLKKRKTAQTVREQELGSEKDTDAQDSQASQYPTQDFRPLSSANLDQSQPRALQTVTDSEESDDSDMEWEDALLKDQDHDEEDEEPEIGDLDITIGNVDEDLQRTKRQTRRRGITSVDKKLRLDIHKMHILCLLYHVHRRNAWCNDERVQSTLRKLAPTKALANLIVNPEHSQYQTSKRFLEGIAELKTLWSTRFKANRQGMHKPRWVDAGAEAQAFSAFDDLDDPMDRQDFRKAAAALRGSQDVGAQLFCALLRGIGIEARLVCSLQVLPFVSSAQVSTPSKNSPDKKVIHLDPYGADDNPSKSKRTSPTRPKRLSRLERILGERHPALSTGVAPKQQKKYHSAFPVYWVEVFNAATQKWVPVDPLSTSTVDRPEKLEPPLNSAQNSLVYAVGFEDDSTAKDVTRRYAKAFNAKTRKFRVECTEGGTRWWKRALKIFKRREALDRDQVEDAALARREAAEGMPKNVQDFKGHPVYVLERHLKHNEIIHSMHQVGKVNVGSAMNPKMEPIYRSKDVHVVRSADKWYRMGRDVKVGEQPLKHAKPKKGARRPISPSMDEDQQEEEVGAGLYAAFQTELYVPPPVVRGRVPRNAYGNLDLYVPSMVPKGGVHIRHKLSAKAARIVSVDHADAVTGFSFKGRHGTAVVQGVVVAREYKDAVEAAIEAMEYEQEETEHSARSAEALRLWRRFYLGLRIAQRVNAIEIDGEIGPVVDVRDEIEKEDRALNEKNFAGGFFPDGGENIPEPSPVLRSRRLTEEDDYGGGFMVTDNDSGGFLPEDDDARSPQVAEAAHQSDFAYQRSTSFGSSLLEQQQLRPRQSEDFSGGFIPEDEEDDIMYHESPSEPPSATETGGVFKQNATASDSGGGFIPESETDSIAVAPTNTTPTETSASLVTAVLTEQEQRTISEAASPSEAGSLPLEDPDDEDADPEWLVDVT
ncbi:Rad4-domain-containing protein [Polyplosphaeria fusca]|uniref:Rad4-domain-containing protein n=1 Tax=Polyplosphaeria fusca TaxID=682080 RepID=A0A9P4QZH1_9PLEO|nr:Rad4-domain-containing protein [Polyplosphaeria fusca]